MLPLVSIIVPVHNAQSTINTCVDSILAQSHSPIELILCNDHSSDQTKSQLGERLNDRRVRWIDTKNRGACAARNLGFEHSTGQFIQFFDADDLLSPDKIERQISQLSDSQNPNSTISFSALIQFKDGCDPESGVPWHTSNVSSSEPLKFLFNLLAGEKFIQTGQWLTPRALVEKAGSWDESLAADQDGEFFSRVLKHAEYVTSCPDAKTYYRRNAEGQISGGGRKEHFASRLQAFEQKLELIANEGSKKDRQVIVKNQCTGLAYSSYPKAKKVSKRALDLLREHSCAFDPVFPSTVTKKIGSIFGWKAARWCSFLKHRGNG